MSLSNKPPSMQLFKLILYRRPLHPELVQIRDRRVIHQPDYEFEAWLMPAGHVLRFQAGGHTVTELVTEQDQDQDMQLPENGLLHTLPCFGEKEHDQTIDDKIRYVASVQTEMLSENLYSATYQEMRDFAAENGAMEHTWTGSDDAPNLSVLDIQRFKSEIHAQSYHLLHAGGFVLRTQSICEMI